MLHQQLGDTLLFTLPLHFFVLAKQYQATITNLEAKLDLFIYLFLILLDIQFKTLARVESSRKSELKIIRTNKNKEEGIWKKIALVYV